MAGKGSAPGERRGGREKGTPNKKTQQLEEYLDAIGCDPLEVMAKIAMGEPLLCRASVNDAKLHGVNMPKSDGDDDFIEIEMRPTFDQRMTAAKELMQYRYPKRRAIEHSGNNGSPIVIVKDFAGEK